MAERAYFPNSPACEHWETLLADALDGMLQPEDEAVFAEHKASCPACTALFEETRRGREWMEFLAPEPEVPSGLLEKILAETGPGKTAGFQLASPGGQVLPLPNLWQRRTIPALLRRFTEPRLMMTAAMAFFSIALTLNLTGVRPSQMRLSDLRPEALRSLMERRLTMASTPVVRYYDHLRLVYEFQSRVRELKHSTEVGSEEPAKQDQQQPSPGQSRQAAPRQQEQTPTYSMEVLESNLTSPTTHSGGFAEAQQEGSTAWIA
ncbi:anti-sigma factor family protein [Telmatobacter bradus]|uniref:anti-sigma factor family protein n=1 Tax=Telmatobacter bradus TaxID=474953 RepID=UPI003B43097B